MVLGSLTAPRDGEVAMSIALVADEPFTVHHMLLPIHEARNTHAHGESCFAGKSTEIQPLRRHLGPLQVEEGMPDQFGAIALSLSNVLEIQMNEQVATKTRAFRELHHRSESEGPLVLPGPWDASSARVFAKAGYPALATPSAGIAASLGHEDGSTPAEEMFAAIARIVASVDIPVSADVETGYGLTATELVERLLDVGAVGCNLEDSDATGLRDPEKHAAWLTEFVEASSGRIFLNARVDTFIRGDCSTESAIHRARLYESAGADCVYPINVPVEKIPVLRNALQGPINVGDQPGGRALGELGATRITFGPRLLQRTMTALEDIVAGLE